MVLGCHTHLNLISQFMFKELWQNSWILSSGRMLLTGTRRREKIVCASGYRRARFNLRISKAKPISLYTACLSLSHGNNFVHFASPPESARHRILGYQINFKLNQDPKQAYLPSIQLNSVSWAQNHRKTYTAILKLQKPFRPLSFSKAPKNSR